MPKPAPKTALRKAPGREHPVAPTPAPLAAPSSGSPSQAAPLAMFSVRLDQGLRRQVRLHAAEREVSLQELVTEALTEYLERHRTSETSA